MSPQEFEQLVDRLSRRAQRHPALYRLQVVGLALLGYLYILLLVIGAVAVSIATAALCIFKPVLLVKLIKIIWLPIWFAWSVLRALWVRLEPPQGRVLQPSEAPRLFEEIERIRSAMGGPHPHVVLLTDDYNAAVTQVPRLGLLGWPRNYLIVGLPMMSALSPDQLRAVIAHEFGHLCAGDSKIGGRVYHARITWSRLQEQMQERGSWLIRRFLDWFAPTFNAYSFVLARAQEYAADQASVRVVGAAPAAEALVLAGVGAHFQQAEIWEPLWKRVRDEPQPAQRPHARLLESGGAMLGWAGAETQLQRSLKRRTDWSDTHPALSDRLAAIGQDGRVPTHGGPSAAQAFLGSLAETLAGELDARWFDAVADQWREQHEHVQERRAQLAELEARPTLSTEERTQQARLAEEIHGADAALPLFEALLADQQDDAGANYAVGRLRLAREDESGLPLLRRAVALDDEAAKPEAELAYGFLAERGREAEAQEWRATWLARDELEQQARAERAEFTYKNDYDAAPLDPEVIASITAALARLGFVGSAWLVRKRVTHLPHWHADLLLVKGRWWYWTRPKAWLARVLDQVPVPEGTTVAIYGEDFGKLLKRVKRVAGGRIFHR